SSAPICALTAASSPSSSSSRIAATCTPSSFVSTRMFCGSSVFESSAASTVGFQCSRSEYTLTISDAPSAHPTSKAELLPPPVSLTADVARRGVTIAVAVSRSRSSGGKLRERACRRGERARIFQHGREEIAVRAATLERDLHREVTRHDSVPELVPAQRRRDRRAGLRPNRVHGRDRLAPAVLPVVDEHALALLLQPLRRHEPGMPRFEQTRRLLGEVVGLLERRAPRDRCHHVNAVGAARLDVTREPD